MASKAANKIALMDRLHVPRASPIAPPPRIRLRAVRFGGQARAEVTPKMRRARRPSILRPDIRLGDDLAEFRRLGRYESAELGRAHRARDDALDLELVDDRLVAQRRIGDLVEAADDRS